MTTSELFQKIKSVGFFPIQAEWNTDHSESSELRIIGSLEDFLEAVRALGITVVFLSVWKLEEEDFLYTSENEDELDNSNEEETPSDGLAGNNESFDLTVALPSLADFKKHIGQEHSFNLMAKSQSASISFRLNESWWDSFAEQQDKAIQKVDENREAILEKMAKQELQKEDNLLKQVRSLLSDPEFCCITTQRGMKAYAVEQFPELEKIDEAALRKEIQKLSDKVMARKRK